VRSLGGGAKWRPTAQLVVVVALSIIALIYFVFPVRSQDRPAWLAELWATEAGEVLVAAARSHEPESEAFAPTLAILCGLHLRYDPGPDIDSSIDWTGRTAVLAFDFGDTVIERELQYEAMDAMFAAPLDAADPLAEAIREGSLLTVRSPTGQLPENTFSLAGSTAAIAEMRRSC
jgi:hypothetical protein